MLDFFRLVPKKRTVKIRSKKGIIFNNPSGSKKYIFYIGTFIFLLAIGYLFYLYWPLTRSIITYSNVKKENKSGIINIPKEVEVKIPIEEFSVKIPKIGAFAMVKINVSPFDKKEYLPILEENIVAHAKNTGLPGQKEIATYLFAHSTSQGVQMVRKNSVFYLLGELKENDEVFVNYNGQKYTYKVYSQKIVSASEIEYLNYKEDGKEILILQTCWPLGTDWKRLLIFAERI